MNKSVVIITAHCDTQEKIDTLIECIFEIKSQGYPIIVSSHIQVPDTIYDMVDYVVFDKENPLISHDEFSEYSSAATWFWTSYDGFYQKYDFDYNHGYAGLKLLKNAAAIAYINGYINSHFICYDYIIRDKEVLQNHNSFLESNDFFLYDIGNQNMTENYQEIICGGFFSFNNEFFLKSFADIKSKKDYADCKAAIFEELLQRKIIANSARIHRAKLTDINENNIIDKFTTDRMKKHVFENLGFLFLSKVENDFYIYFISFQESTLILEIDNQTYKLNSMPFKSNLIPVTIDHLSSGIKINIPNFQFNDTYNLHSRYSYGTINDSNIILNLNNLKEINE